MSSIVQTNNESRICKMTSNFGSLFLVKSRVNSLRYIVLVSNPTIRYLSDDILKVRLAPRLCGMLHAASSSVVVLLVLVVQEH